MGHLTTKTEIWEELRGRLDRHPIGLPRHAAIERILSMLFTREEAELAVAFPTTTVGIEGLISSTGRSEEEILPLLDSMAAKGLVLEIVKDDRKSYWLSAAFPGFFEYTFMRVRENFPYSEMARLMEDYFRESGFAKEIAGMGTQRTRTLVRRDSLGEDLVSEVLPYETARGLIEQGESGSLQTCYCRHKVVHLGGSCSLKAPVDEICMSFGVTADFLVRRGFARRADRSGLLRALDRAEEAGLVHIVDNFRENVIFMCHCCGCCCELLRILTEKRIHLGIAPTRFVPVVDEEKCASCGTCQRRCQIGAIRMEPGGAAQVDEEWCIGCGICVAGCPSGALRLRPRATPLLPPRDLKAMTLRILKAKRRS